MISVHREMLLLRIVLNLNVLAFFLTMALVGFSDPCNPIDLATSNLPVAIEKTFDIGTLIGHTVSVQQGDHRASMRVSQRRKTAGSLAIASAHLTFYPGTPVEMPILTAAVFREPAGQYDERPLRSIGWRSQTEESGNRRLHGDQRS